MVTKKPQVPQNSPKTVDDGNIKSAVKPAAAFATQRDKDKDDKKDGLNLYAMMMMADANRNNDLNGDALPDSLGLYIPEDFDVQNGASVTLNGETITSQNFYSHDDSSSGSGLGGYSFGDTIFRGGNYDVGNFIPHLPKGKIHADGTFEQAFAIVLASEGGFANNKNDRGGATIFGIASRSNPNEYKQIMNLLNSGDKQGAINVTMQTYKNKYWDAAGIDNLQDADARLVAFDAAINHGAGFARKMIRNTGEDANAMLQYRANAYIQIVANDSSQQVFMKGWRNRLGKLDSIVDSDAPSTQVASAMSVKTHLPAPVSRTSFAGEVAPHKQLASTPVAAAAAHSAFTAPNLMTAAADRLHDGVRMAQNGLKAMGLDLNMG